MDTKTFNRIANRIVSLEAHLDNHIEFMGRQSDGRYTRDEDGNLIPIAAGVAGVGAAAYGGNTLRRAVNNTYGGNWKDAFNARGAGLGESMGNVVKGDYEAVKAAPGKAYGAVKGYGADKIGAAKRLIRKGAIGVSKAMR